MPHLSGLIGPYGPLVSVIVHMSGPRISTMQSMGRVPPAPVIATLLVDTGATLTSVDITILQQLGLTPTGQVAIHTPSTQGKPHSCDQYDVGLTILAPNNAVGFINTAIPVLDGHFKGQGIDGLLGRDVLSTARLHYAGADGWFGLSF